MAFSELGLSPELVRAVTDAGYVTPTPIQAQAIPSILTGRDVLGVAQTGTGKTASFTLPMIDILAQGRSRARMPRSLILEPTRELAAQVSENFDKYGKYSKLSMALLIGGVSYADQEKLLDRGVDVLIATPGRLMDHFERGRILLNDVKVLVIDEADRMLDMGFIPDVEKIVAMLPKRRQTLFFSATMAPEIKRLADAFLNDPKLISVAPPASPAALVAQHVTVVLEDEKREALRRIIASEDVRNAIIFCNRKKDIGVLHKSLQKHGFNVQALHGDLAQSVRTDTLERFKKGEITYLIASDVAARGLDIADLSHVFNFDVPINAEDYIHRIGRTGRAGKTGRAFMIATPDDTKAIEAIESLIKKEIPRIVVEGVSAAELDPDARKGRRRGGKPAARASEPQAARAPRPAPSRPVAAAAPPRQPIDPSLSDQPDIDLPIAASNHGPLIEPARPTAARPIEARRPDPRSERGGDRGGERGYDRNAKRRGGGRYEEDDAPVKGLGDHVPAFLLRAVKLPAKRA